MVEAASALAVLLRRSIDPAPQRQASRRSGNLGHSYELL
jgi:hypothetical protein